MALDVQPLSKTRQLLMLVVMLALLGGSLGLAQALMMRRAGAETAVVTVEWNFPRELNRKAPGIQKLDGVVICRGGIVRGHQRWAAGMMERVGSASKEEAMTEAQELFGRMVDTERVLAGEAKFAGREGVEVEGMGADGNFGILRMTIAADKAVAICYSGPGEITDGDRLYFDGLCDRVEIREESPRTGK